MCTAVSFKRKMVVGVEVVVKVDGIHGGFFKYLLHGVEQVVDDFRPSRVELQGKRSVTFPGGEDQIGAQTGDVFGRESPQIGGSAQFGGVGDAVGVEPCVELDAVFMALPDHPRQGIEGAEGLSLFAADPCAEGIVL